MQYNCVSIEFAWFISCTSTVSNIIHIIICGLLYYCMVKIIYLGINVFYNVGKMNVWVSTNISTWLESPEKWRKNILFICITITLCSFIENNFACIESFSAWWWLCISYSSFDSDFSSLQIYIEHEDEQI